MPENVFKTTKFFEKSEIKWICVDDIKKMRPQFRCYLQHIIEMMLNQKESIKNFIERSKKKKKKNTFRKKIRIRSKTSKKK